MTIYRLNRVPDKLHVALLELLGIRLDGPSAAQTTLRFRLAEPAARAARRSRAARPRSARRARPTEESIIFQVDEDFDDPADAAGRLRAPARRPGQERRRRRRRRAARSGADQLAFGDPPAVGDALYLGFEEPIGAAADAGRRRRLAGPRRRREPRGPAAALGGLPGRRRVGRGARCSRTSPAASTTAAARSSSSCRRARRSSRSAATGCTGCAAASTTRRATAAPATDLLAAAGDLLDHRRADRRRLPATHAAQIEREVARRRPTARRARSFRCAIAPVLKPHGRRDARGAGPGVRRLGALGAARRLRRLDRARPPLLPRPRLGRRSSSAPRSARPTAAGRSTARSRRRARCCASPATATAAGGRATSTAGHADGAEEHDRRASTRSPTRTRRSAASTPSSSSTRASARRWRSARRYRAVTAEDFEFLAGEASPRVARAVCIPPREGGAGAAAHRPARRPRRPPARLRRARARRGADAGGRRVPRRAAADRHDGAAAAVPLPRPVGRRQPAGRAARRHARASRRTSRTRCTRT